MRSFLPILLVLLVAALAGCGAHSTTASAPAPVIGGSYVGHDWTHARELYVSLTAAGGGSYDMAATLSTGEAVTGTLSLGVPAMSSDGKYPLMLTEDSQGRLHLTIGTWTYLLAMPG